MVSAFSTYAFLFKQVYISCLQGALHLHTFAILFQSTVGYFVCVEITNPLDISDLHFPLLCECGY